MQSAAMAFDLKIPSKVEEGRKKIRWVPLGNRQIPLAVTYFPGHNRHKGRECIAPDIREILGQEPKTSQGHATDCS